MAPFASPRPDVKVEPASVRWEVGVTRIWTLLAIGCGALSVFGAQPDEANWLRVEQLQSGQTLRVLCSEEQTWMGRLAGVTDNTLTLSIGGAERTIARSDVLRVDVRSRARSALIGLGIGAGAGAGYGYAAGRRARLKSSEATAAVGLGTGLGAADGAVIGVLSGGWKTVYRGEPPSSPRVLDSTGSLSR